MLVADREEPRLGAAKLLDEVELDPVRVLELVHHQVLEAPVPLLADRRRGAKELDGVDLEVGEVEARADPLELRIAPVGLVEHGVERRPRLQREAPLVDISSRSSSFCERLGSPTSGRRGAAMPWLRSRSCATSVMSRMRYGR